MFLNFCMNEVEKNEEFYFYFSQFPSDLLEILR